MSSSCSQFGNVLQRPVQVIALRTLKTFWAKHPKAQAPLSSWYVIACAAKWKGPADVKAEFRSADMIADNRIIFDIGGNNYRLVVRVSYTYQAVQIKFVGTHAEYDKINAETIR